MSSFHKCMYLKGLHELCEHFLLCALVHDHIGMTGGIVQAFDFMKFNCTRAVCIEFAECEVHQLFAVLIQHTLNSQVIYKIYDKMR